MDWQPPKEWEFLRVLQQNFDADVCFGQAPKSFHSQFEKIIGLWRTYVLTAVRALFKSGRYDFVYAWHAVIGLVFAAFCRFFRLRNVRIVVAQLIVPRKGDSLAQRIKQAFTRYALKRVELVIAYSSVEVEQFEKAYANGFTRFVFTPLGIDLPSVDSVRDDGYVFSGGRSNRDYQTLIEAVRSVDAPIHIAAQRFNLRNAETPPNVIVHYNAFGEAFERLLAAAALVVIPLDRDDESSGQLVLLQAMALGKAIVVTENRGLADYCQPGKTVVVAPPHDPRALRERIVRLLANAKERARLGEAAREYVQQFTLHNQAERVAGIMNRMMR